MAGKANQAAKRSEALDESLASCCLRAAQKLPLAAAVECLLLRLTTGQIQKITVY
jgi:hypothetical protein